MVKIWKQTTIFTCAPSSLMMLLNHLGKCGLSKSKEMELWKESRTKPLKVESEFGIALAMKRKGIEPEIITTSKTPKKEEIEFCFLYENIPKNRQEKTFEIYKKNKILLEERVHKSGIKLIRRMPNAKNVIKFLENGPVMVILDDFTINKKKAKKHCIHTVLVTKKSGNFFHINDPWYGKIKISEKELNSSLRMLKTKLKTNPAVIGIKNVIG